MKKIGPEACIPSAPLRSTTDIIVWISCSSHTAVQWNNTYHECISSGMIMLCGVFLPQRCCTSHHWQNANAIGGSKGGGGARDARPPPGAQILSFSCSFRQKVEKIIPLWELAPPLRKILDPPLNAVMKHFFAHISNTERNPLFFIHRIKYHKSRSLTVWPTLCWMKNCLLIGWRWFWVCSFHHLLVGRRWRGMQWWGTNSVRR